MAEDIVERLRRIDLGRMDQQRAMERAADEIEQLRAIVKDANRAADLRILEIEDSPAVDALLLELDRAGDEIDRLREVVANWQTEAEMEQARRTELQALIDAVAAVWDRDDEDPTRYGAVTALLAVATKKEDDRG